MNKKQGISGRFFYLQTSGTVCEDGGENEDGMSKVLCEFGCKRLVANDAPAPLIVEAGISKMVVVGIQI